MKNETRSNLTEYKSRFIQANPYLIECYLFLRPPSLSILALRLFLLILSSKYYGKKIYKTRGSIEEKRIYSDCSVTIEDICRMLYAEDNVKSSYANVLARVKELDDLNIHYRWDLCGENIFIMERDVGVWKVYNENAYVTPKSVLKIIDLSSSMIEEMQEMINNKYIVSGNPKRVRYITVEDSFKKFLDRMIRKMHPSIIEKLPEANTEKDLKKYLHTIKVILHELDKYYGLNESDNFMKNLPICSSECLDRLRSKKNEPEGEETMHTISKKSRLDRDLIPDNSVIGKPIIKRKKHNSSMQRDKMSDGIKAEVVTFEGIGDPLSCPKKFSQYYRNFIGSRLKNVFFDTYDTDIRYATNVLDLMRDGNRFTKRFLDSFLIYFVEHKLKGEKHKNIKYTSIKNLIDAFDEYMLLYHEPDVV